MLNKLQMMKTDSAWYHGVPKLALHPSLLAEDRAHADVPDPVVLRVAASQVDQRVACERATTAGCRTTAPRAT